MDDLALLITVKYDGNKFHLVVDGETPGAVIYNWLVKKTKGNMNEIHVTMAYTEVMLEDDDAETPDSPEPRASMELLDADRPVRRGGPDPARTD